MRKVLCLRYALVAVALSCASLAQSADINFSGSMTGSGVLAPSGACAPVPFQATITAGLGTSPFGAFSYNHTTCVTGGAGPVNGTFLIAFSTDQFSGTLTGKAVADATPGLFDDFLNYTITGGTGRFAGATGSFIGSGTVDANFRPAKISFNFAAVPELSTWAMMLIGFGSIGFAMRLGRSSVRTQTA